MTVFTPVQLISTQQGKIAALFALPNEALHVFQSLVEFNLQTIKSVQSRLSAYPPTASMALQQVALPIPRIAWQ